MIPFWHTLRRTRQDGALRQRNEELKQQVAELEQRLESVQSMLYSSRFVYGKALQRISELETELTEQRDVEDLAARQWLGRFHNVTVNVN